MSPAFTFNLSQPSLDTLRQPVLGSSAIPSQIATAVVSTAEMMDSVEMPDATNVVSRDTLDIVIVHVFIHLASTDHMDTPFMTPTRLVLIFVSISSLLLEVFTSYYCFWFNYVTLARTTEH